MPLLQVFTGKSRVLDLLPFIQRQWLFHWKQGCILVQPIHKGTFSSLRLTMASQKPADILGRESIKITRVYLRSGAVFIQLTFGNNTADKSPGAEGKHM